MVEIIGTIVLVLLGWWLLASINGRHDTFRHDCSAKGGHTVTQKASRSTVYICLDQDGKFLYSKNLI